MADKDFSTSRLGVLEGKEPTKAKDIAKTGVITVRKDKSVYEAIGIMVERNISGLPVVDDGGLVGIITEKDVLRLLCDTEFLSGSVEDYMTGDVVSFDEEDSLSSICACLMDNPFRRVPILHEGKLVGIISRADLIKANKDRFKPQGVFEECRRRADGPLVKDVMKCGLLTVERQAPIYEVIEILSTRNVTGLPVVDDCMNLVGIVSEKDMLRFLYDPAAKPGRAEDFMTEEVVSFSPDDSLFAVCECLMNNNFRRVPILNQGKIVGIVSRADVIVHILRNKSAMFSRRRR
jgi:CBS domain-containing protein